MLYCVGELQLQFPFSHLSPSLSLLAHSLLESLSRLDVPIQYRLSTLLLPQQILAACPSPVSPSWWAPVSFPYSASFLVSWALVLFSFPLLEWQPDHPSCLLETAFGCPQSGSGWSAEAATGKFGVHSCFPGETWGGPSSPLCLCMHRQVPGEGCEVLELSKYGFFENASSKITT